MADLKKMRLARRGAVVAGIVAASMALAACSGMGQPSPNTNTNTNNGAEALPGSVLSQEEWDELVEAATAEGEVVVYSSQSGAEATFARFTEAYPGISVRIERAPTAELITRLDQELAVGARGGDLVLHTLPGWFAGHDSDGSFAPLQVGPEAAEHGWDDRIDGHNYSPAWATPLLLGANTNSGEVPNEADEIMDAPGDARIAVIDPSITTAQAFQYQLWLDEYGDDFLAKLAERNPTVYSSNVPLAQDLAAGALDYGLGVAASTILTLKGEGAPIDAVIPKAAVGGLLYNVAVRANAPHPNAAQLFVNWLTSPAGAEAIHENHAPVAVPMELEGAVPWDSMTHMDTSVWTTEYWQDWIAEEWTPHFG
jgi:iron(III) transport system substrate-binding protein